MPRLVTADGVLDFWKGAPRAFTMRRRSSALQNLKLGATSMELSEINRVLRLVDRELWIITAAAGGRRGGLTATAVTVGSLDPKRPMLLVGITPSHYTAELLCASEAFGAHLLRPDQGSIAWNFADGSGRDRDKLAGLATNTGVNGSADPRRLPGLAGVPNRQPVHRGRPPIFLGRDHRRGTTVAPARRWAITPLSPA